MNKKEILLLYVFFIFTLSAGIFTEIASPCSSLSLCWDSASALSGLTDCLRSDLLTVLTVLLLSSAALLLPLSVILIALRVFAMGFTAAFLLSRMAGSGKELLLAVLLPRALFKLPAYMLLLLLALKTPGLLWEIRRNPAKKKALRPLLRAYLLVLLTLLLSSLLEVFLLHLIL